MHSGQQDADYTYYRRAKAIEQELYKRADGQASCAELAAVLQEWDTSTPCCGDC